MGISELSIRRPVFAWMLMAVLVVFGALCFYKMGISQLPDVDFPVVSINIRLEGAAPEVIETEIVDIVEDAVMGVESVKSVTSRSENSEGTITVEFELNRNIDLAVQNIQSKLSQIQARLPKEVTAITVSKTNPEDQPIMFLTLESEKYPLRDLMYYVSDHLKDQFAMVSGVGDITLGGYVEPNLRIWISGEKLRQYQLSVSDVISTIQNEHSEQPTGKVEDSSRNHMFYVRTMGEATTVEQFGDIIINQRGGQPNFTPIKLKQVARIEDGLADILRFARAKGVPGVGLGIMKQRGSNAVEVAKAVRAKMVLIQKTLPDGMKLSVNFDSSRYIEQAVSELNFTLLLSALLTALVCWLFLGSWSSTINVLFAIPTSVIGSFIVLYFLGFTLNTFTLLGLSLSIGIVVDDAIMVLENIIRHQEKGQNKFMAALLGSKEITFAAVAATISIIAIFLPVVFMKGIIGKFFFQFGITITVAVLLSLLEALTLTPMRCSQFVDIGERKTRLGKSVEKILDVITAFYRRTLRSTLAHPLKTVFISLVFFALSFSTIGFLNKEFLPSEDQSRFNIRLKTPIGSSLYFSDAKFKEVEKFLNSRNEIDRFVVQVGGGSPGDANSGSVLVTMKDKGKRGIDPTKGHELSQIEMMDLCRVELKKIKDLRAVIQDPSTKSFTASRGFPVEFTVQGPDWEKLAVYAKQMSAELEKTGLVTDLDMNYDSAMPEMQVIPDRAKASAQGVSIYNIGETVNAMIGGVLVGRYPKNGHRYDISLKLEESQEDPISKMNHLYVRNNRGELSALSNLVEIKNNISMAEINRRDRERAITVYANVKTGKSQQEALTAAQNIATKILPPQYHIQLSGSSQSYNESFQSLIIALILGLFVAYAVLASHFNSFVDPLTVLMALPFSVSGAFVALLITHQTINIYSMIGLVLLMGIVKKNSILLVDFTNRVRFGKTDLNSREVVSTSELSSSSELVSTSELMSANEALLEACPIRLRPILMTSVATVAGAIPAALALGPGAESRIPMAVSIIGGVIVSTILTLYVVPCVYSLLSSKNKRAST
jgi:hydrophobe/amphiphile efflux-1 (HAE1) family protein